MNSIYTFVKVRWPVLIALSAIFLQPFGRTVELPLLIMAVVGLFDFLRPSSEVRSLPSFKLFTGIFLCFWIPSLLSLFDAVNTSKSITTALGMLRFYFAGIFILARLATPDSIRLVASGCAFIALFWASDNVFQAVFGFDFFGRSPVSGRIPGIFGDSPRSGWMLIPLMFVAALYFWRSYKRTVSLTILFVLAVAVFLSGDRGAIVALGWSGLGLCIWAWMRGYRLHSRNAVLGCSMLALIGVAMFQVPQVMERFEKTATVLDGGYEAWDKATSRRLTLWSTALKLVEDNEVNGVGVRGFRYAYPEYAPQGDLYVDGDTGAYHAHQIVIEILADTGLIGFVGYICALGIFVWLMREAMRRRTYLALGYLASVIGVLMPINSHLSLYSSYWAQACWFLFAMAVVTVFHENAQQKAEV